MCYTVYSFLLEENIATNLKLNNAILIIYGLYALVVIKNMCLRDKSRNYCPRKLPGACHGGDFGLVEK